MYSAAIDWPFRSLEKHKAKAKRCPQSFLTRRMSFDRVLQENSMKSLGVLCVSVQGDCGSELWAWGGVMGTPCECI